MEVPCPPYQLTGGSREPPPLGHSESLNFPLNRAESSISNLRGVDKYTNIFNKNHIKCSSPISGGSMWGRAGSADPTASRGESPGNALHRLPTP